MSHIRRGAPTGVVGVVRRAEERRRREELASGTARTYMQQHRLPETIDDLLGALLVTKPDDPFADLEERLRRISQQRFGEGPVQGAAMPAASDVPSTTTDAQGATGAAGAGAGRADYEAAVPEDNGGDDGSGDEAI